MKTRWLTIAALAAIGALTLGLVATPGSAHSSKVTQRLPMMWHAQSGNTGEVGDDAVATLTRDRRGIKYAIRTSGLVPGNAYTLWFVVVNDPGLDRKSVV